MSALAASTWVEADHPRHAAGTPEGGQFRSLYHVSPVSNRAAIRREGLLAEAPKRYVDDPEPGVYVFDNFEDAWRYATTGERQYGDFDIWESTPDGLEFGPDPFFEPGAPMAERAEKQFGRRPGAWVTRQSIPPEQLRLRFGSPWFPEGRFKDLGEVQLSNPDAGLEVHMTDGGIALDQIRVHPDKRGQGLASNALDDVLTFADDRGLPVALDIGHDELDQKMFGGLSKTAKEKWYRSRGFVPNKGRNKDFAFRQSWIRKPRATTAALELAFYGAAWDESKHPRHPAGSEMGGKWRSLKPGDRVAMVQTGQEGTVEKVNVPPKGISAGQAWVRVKWDKSGESSRVANPGYNLAGTQSDEFLQGALHSWAGYPTDMRLQMAAEMEGRPEPSSAGGREMRAQARALLGAVRAGRQNDVKLYRGALTLESPVPVPQSWSESKTVARKWAGKDGQVFELEPGQATGIRMRDYISSGMDVREKQWLIDPLSYPEALRASGWDESEHPRWPEGHPEGGKFRPKDSFAGVDYDDIQSQLDKLEGRENEYHTKRHRVKVGQAKHLREEIENWFLNTRVEGPNGQLVWGLDPKWQSIVDNWGNWTTPELYALRDELAKQLSEGGWDDPLSPDKRWMSSGLLSAQYAREIGRSLSQARNEAKRLYEAVDKALTIEQFGLERAQELYPELFEVKTPKVKAPDPRSQGVPDVYLSESGKFKPGYDAKLKSDLVNSYFDLNPQQKVTTIGQITPETKQALIDDWKARNPSRTQDSSGREWTDEEIWPAVQTDELGMHPDLRRRYVRETRRTSTAESTLLHRFTPDEAMRILDERGWSKYLEEARHSKVGGALAGEPTADQLAERSRLERVYGAGDQTPWSSKGNFNVNGYHLKPVQELVGEAAEIPDSIHSRLADKGVTLYFGPPESTDLDEMWHIRDEKARNRDRRTMKQVAGFYSPSSKRVIISSDSRVGSSSLAAHEIGHAIGDVLGVDHSRDLQRFHDRLKPKLGKYYLQHGDDYAGRQELWAEGVALHYHLQRNQRLGREVIYRRSGPFKKADTLDTPEGREYMAWVAHVLKELEEGRDIPE